MPITLRTELTPAQFRALKILAVEREQTLQELVSEALLTSPLTREVLEQAIERTA